MPPPQSRGLFRWAAALLLVGFAAFFSWRLLTGAGTGATHEIALATDTEINNTGTAVKDLVMSDGSGIRLYPQQQHPVPAAI